MYWWRKGGFVMTSISFKLIDTIREYINEPFFSNRFRLLELEKWLKITSTLDTIEDASVAINYYSKDVSTEELGKLYLHIYGLLQALYVSQDCVVSLRKAILDKRIDFKEESPDIYFVREVRGDILHATNRGITNKSYIYLTQWSLSKRYFEYHKQSVKKLTPDNLCVDVNILIEKNNKEINRFLEEIKNNLESELKMKKEEYSKQKLSDIFNSLNYAAEKISEKSFLSQIEYNKTKDILKKYKETLNERYTSWKECAADSYEIEFIEKIYDIIDGKILDQSHIPCEKIDVLKEILLDNLICHFQKLEENAKEHDDYCIEEYTDESDCNDITINIICPDKTVE